MLRAFSALFLWGGANKITGIDSYFYDPIARNLLSGKGYSLNGINPTADRPPLFTFLLAFLYFCFNYKIPIVKLVLAAIGSLEIFIVFIIGKKIFDQRIGIVSAMVFAISPIFLRFSAHFNSESLFTGLFLLGIFYLGCIERQKIIKYMALSGGFIGLATLTRPVSLLFPMCLLPWIFIQRDWNYKTKISAYLVFLLAFSAVISPWIVRNYLVFKSLVMTTQSGESLFLSHYPKEGTHWKLYLDTEVMREKEDYVKSMSEVEREKRLMSIGIKFILSAKKSDLLWRIIVNEIVILTPFFLYNPNIGYDLQFGLIFPFFILGVYLWIKSKSIRPSILVLPILNLILITAIFYGNPRYRIPFLPYFIILSAYGFFNLKERISKSNSLIILTIIINLLLNYLLERGYQYQ